MGRLALAVGYTALATGAGAAPRALVDRSLSRTDVDLVGWDDAVVSFRDALGRVREEPVGEIVAILPIEPGEIGSLERPGEEALAGGTPVVVELVDGQRLIGSMGPWDSASVGADDLTDLPEVVAVYSSRAGVERVPLDRVSRVVVDPWSRGSARPTAWAVGVDDEVVFRNGDRVGGFVLEIAEGVVFDDGEHERRFGLGQIAEIRLGNETVPGTSPRIWTRAGEIRDARSVGFDDNGNLTFVDPGSGDSAEGDRAEHRSGSAGAVGPIDRSLDDVLSANVGGARLISLASLERAEVIPGAGRRWTPSPRAGSLSAAPFGSPHVVLPGPMRTVWRLPPDAARFGTVARLGGTLDRPDARAGRWADAGVRVLVRTDDGEQLLHDGTLDRGAADALITVELPGIGEIGRLLIVEATEGRFGPIQDTVLLDRPMLLLTGTP